jgi:hypothetical protein
VHPAAAAGADGRNSNSSVILDSTVIVSGKRGSRGTMPLQTAACTPASYAVAAAAEEMLLCNMGGSIGEPHFAAAAASGNAAPAGAASGKLGGASTAAAAAAALMSRGFSGDLGFGGAGGSVLPSSLELDALELERDGFMGVLDDMLAPCDVDADLLMMG